jgi:hypothetical protein
MQLVDEENREEISSYQGISSHPRFTAIVCPKDRTAITYYDGGLRRSEPYACENRVADTTLLPPISTSIGCNQKGASRAYCDSILCVSKGHRKEMSRSVTGLRFPGTTSICRR